MEYSTQIFTKTCQFYTGKDIHLKDTGELFNLKLYI